MLPKPFNSLIHKACTTKVLEKGEFVFRQNDHPFAMFFLTTGIVQLERHTSSGDKVIIHRATDGQTFAEASLFSATYHCDAIAIADAQIIALDKASILKAMKADPDFAETLAARFAEQVQSYRRQIEIRTIRPAIERVYSSLAAGMLTNDIMSFANEIGLSHEATYRALSELAAVGRIGKSGRGTYLLT